MRRIARLLPLLLTMPLAMNVALAADAKSDALPPESETWRRLVTENFTIYSDASERAVTDLARELETLRAVMRKAMAGAREAADVPVSVYVFRTTRGFERFSGDVAGGSKLAGFHVRTTGMSVLAVNLDAPGSPRGTMFHEYTHHLMGAMFGELPLWVNEGFAEFFSTFRLAGGKAEIGRPELGMLEQLRQQPLIPLPTLLAADDSSPLYSGEGEHGMYYAQSWALVHMLMVSSPERRNQLPRYLDLRENGESADAAARTAFGTDFAGLERQLEAYVHRAQMLWLIYETGELPKPWIGELEPLDRAHTLTHLGRLLAASRNDPKAAEPYFRAALAIEPANPLAEAGLAGLMWRSGRRDEALALYNAALARDPRDPEVNRLAAFSILDRYLGGSERPPTDKVNEEIARARGMLAVVLEFKPKDVSALLAYGMTWAYDPGDPALGVKALEKAVALDPRNSAALLGLTRLYVKANAGDKARAVVDGPLARAGKAEDRAMGRELLLELDLRAAEAAARAGKMDEAARLLEQVRDRTTDPDLRKQIEEHLARLAVVRKHNAQVDRFNEAVRLGNSGKTPEARAILETLVGEDTDEEIRTRAAEILSSLAKPAAAKKR